MMITPEQVKAWIDKNPDDLMCKTFLASDELKSLMKDWAKKDSQRWSSIALGELEEDIDEIEVEKTLWHLYGGDYRCPESYKIYADFLNDSPLAAKAFLKVLELEENEERACQTKR